ncbi:precorrin-6A/cobalt-precorrin-6A reductase [Aquimarina sp. W85]|uniref:precorrin-6A/cobalt-precorrin-6A reductase n=1 Tax=Aquimarina rhodophyticola TaxID=3342246 RepID=UPI003671612B
MILVFGGTTEGKKIAALLQEKEIPFVYSTKTNISFETTNIASYRYGALTQVLLKQYIVEHRIHTIINAAHPFAEILHTTVAKVAEALQIPVIRFGRKLLPKTKHPLVSYVGTYAAALEILEKNKTLLALTGVQSIKKLKSWWQHNTTYFRILNRPESLAIASLDNFPKSQLILGLPSSNLDEEIALITNKNIAYILTKETGNSGFLSTKIQAALHTNTKILIITQPDLPSYFKQVFNEAEVYDLLVSTQAVSSLLKNPIV